MRAEGGGRESPKAIAGPAVAQSLERARSLVADQLGHGIGVNLDTYTVAGLDQRLVAVNALEQSLESTSIN